MWIRHCGHFSLDNSVSSYQSDRFIPQIPMGKHVRSNTNEITLQRSFIFHIYFIVLLDHTRQYYALIKIVWCLMFSTSNRVFSSKTKEIQYSVVSQWKKSTSIITYLCNYTMTPAHCRIGLFKCNFKSIIFIGQLMLKHHLLQLNA